MECTLVRDTLWTGKYKEPWVNDTNSKWVVFCLTPCEQLFNYIYYGVDKLHLDELVIIPALYYTNTLSWLFIVIAHCNISPWVDMWLAPLGHIILIQINKFLFLLLNDACWVEEKQIAFLYRFKVDSTRALTLDS